MSLFDFFYTKRNNEMQSCAADLGLEYQAADDFGLLSYLKDFKLFDKGYAKKVRHIMRPEQSIDDDQYCIFDYQYTKSYGKSSKTHHQTVFFMNSKKLGLPEFYMRPEGFLLKVGQYLGINEDIDFSANPEFSDQYYLKGDDEEMIRKTYNEDVLYYFTIQKNWSLEGLNYYMIFYRAAERDDRLPVEYIKDFHHKGIEVFELLKKEENQSPE